MTCSTCRFRWFGSFHGFSQWYCRPTDSMDNLQVIGSDEELKAAKGCKFWEGFNCAIEGPEQAQLANGPARMES